MLLLALGLGFLIASPQLWTALRYYPRSIRAYKTAAEKQEIGSVPPSKLILGLVWPTALAKYGQVDGVFYPECVSSIGLVGFLLAILGTNGIWWTFLFLSAALAMGRHTPLFRASWRVHLRIPARYCYFVGLAMAFLALEGFQRLAPPWQAVLLFLQAANLILVHSRLWPMEPYVQRWETPSKVFETALSRYLTGRSGRVSGLPYPLRTGQVNRIHTLGYNGGSQAKWMARFRQDQDPNGSGAHDWFALAEDREILDWYGVRYAYTYRPLTGKWIPTPIPHLYENTQARPAPTWGEAQRIYGDLR